MANKWLNRRTAGILGAIAGYVALESVFFFVPVGGTYGGGMYGGTAFPVIVSTSGMLSALFFGGQASVRRAAWIVGVVVGCFVLMFGIGGCGLAAEWAGLPNDVGLLGASAFLFAAFLAARAKLRRRWVKRDADEWLAQRTCREEHHRHKRMRLAVRRLAPWIPSLSVLVLLFFWSGIWGTALRLVHPRAGESETYRIDIPVTWILKDADKDHSSSSVLAWRLRDAPQATFFFWHNMPSVSVSEMGIYTRMRPERDFSSMPSGSDTRSFRLGPSVITCRTRTKSDALRSAIECSSDDGRFFAWFLGRQVDVASFYEIVSTATPLPAPRY